MADTTITGLTATTSAATADEIPIWVAGSAVTRKITKANFLQGAFTGGGTVATGGYTLTVPATGTAALLGTAQTFSALKTFSAGISFGDETLSNYDIGSWTPALKFGGATTGITYATQVGTYTRIGLLVIATATITLSNKGSATGAATITGLPFTSLSNASSVLYTGSVYWRSMAANGYSVMALLVDNTSTILLYVSTASANSAAMTDANFGNSSELAITLMYEAAVS